MKKVILICDVCKSEIEEKDNVKSKNPIYCFELKLRLFEKFNPDVVDQIQHCCLSCLKKCQRSLGIYE